MSSPRGTFVRISMADQSQIATPGIRMTIDTARSPSVGPPTSKSSGKARFKIAPTTANGSVNSAIFSPLPTSERRSMLASLSSG